MRMAYNLFHPSILKRIDCGLEYTEDQKRHFGQYMTTFTLTDTPATVAAQIRSAKSIHVHPDGFDYWIDVLQVLHEQNPLSVKLFVISGSDHPVRDEHIEFWAALFPNAQFWIQNFCGQHPNCKLFPIGVNFGRHMIDTPKTRTLMISAFNELNSEERTLLKQYLEQTPVLSQYCIPFKCGTDYCEELAISKFSVCPKGNGFDTLRFWESLSEQAIPIVLQNDFTRNLSLHYPGLPFVMLQRWTDLESWIQQDLDALYESIRSTYTDFLPVTLQYWFDMFDTIMNA